MPKPKAVRTARGKCHALLRKFQEKITEVKFDNDLTRKEHCIIDDAEKYRYQEGDIEAAFYKHGGIEGIFVLILYFRSSEAVKGWSAIDEAVQKSFVECVVGLLDDKLVEWIQKYHITRPSLKPLEQVQLVGRHAGRRRQKIHRHGAPTSTNSIPSAERDGSEQQAYRKTSNLSFTTFAQSKEPITAASITHIIIPALIYALGSRQIPRSMLLHGLVRQKRYDDQGNVHEVTLRDVGFEQQTISLFSSRSELEVAVCLAIKLNLVVEGGSKDSVIYSINDEARDYILRFNKRTELHLLGPRFITYIYPRDQILEPSFQTLGKDLSPYLTHAWELVLAEPSLSVPASILESLVEASLATYKLSEKPRLMDVMSLLGKINACGLPDYLRLAIANQESILLRFRGDHDQSSRLLQGILGTTIIDRKDVRSYCAYGRLILSETENAILREDFSKAKLLLEGWEVKSKTNPPLLELQNVRLKNTVLGRVSRYEGDFAHSCHCLEKCLDMVSGHASRFHILHHLGDVYCELGIPEKAVSLVLEEINHLKTRGKQHSKVYRRLVLSLAEAYTQQRMFDIARALLQELLVIFEGIANHDIADQLGHVRTVVGLARVDRSQAQWSKAEQGLEKALLLVDCYSTFPKGTYYKGIIYLFLSVMNFERHRYLEARLALSSADDILLIKRPRHFIPGLGSYFLKDLLQARGIFSGHL